MKLLRRYIFSREADAVKLTASALRWGYHRISWEPITIAELRKRATWQTLTGKDIGDDPMFSVREQRFDLDSNKIFLSAMDADEKFARVYINYLRKSKQLYNPNWDYWSWQFKDDHIMIRWRKTQEWAPIGLTKLERDYQ